MSVIRLDHITKSWGASRAVDDVSVTSIELINNAFAQLRFAALVHYASVPTEDRTRTGPKIRAQLQGIIAFKNGSWLISEHTVEDAEIE